MRYSYSTIRFVPDPARGEFVNLGLIVGSDETGEWRIETVQNRSRARKLEEGSKSLPSVVAELEKIEAQLELALESDYSNALSFEISENWLASMAIESRNVVQYSMPMPIAAESPDEAIEILWPRMIVDKEVVKRTAVTRKNILARFRSEIRKAHLSGNQYKEHAILQASHSKSHIDFAFHNGQVKQLTQCWSFQLQDTESVLTDVKSWAWTVRGLRHSGGDVLAGDARIEVPKDVLLKVVCAKPTTKDDNGVLEEAMDAFADKDVEAEIIEMSNVAGVVDSAVKQLAE